MRQGFRLGDFEPVQPQSVAADSGENAAAEMTDGRRLMREAKRRMTRATRSAQKPKKLSRVERVMQKNAPDLLDNAPSNDGGFTGDVIDMDARWPRPRLLALIVVITLAAVVPSVTVRLLIWLVIMFLLTAVMLGPERARDAGRVVLLHLTHMWGREISLLRRLFGRFAP